MAEPVKQKRFLQARWQHLCLFTYAVPQELLLKRIPAGLELDTLDGKAFVSLVAFDFLDTEVFGIKWPGHTNFPEINLRCYVKHGNDRGVVFIRELVPQFMVATLARLIYNEPYLFCPMESLVTSGVDTLDVEHNTIFANKLYTIKLKAKNLPSIPEDNSIEHFFKEHRWGFGRDHFGKTTRYEVNHPVWQVYPVLSHTLDWDFGAIYGPDFSFLNKEHPYSIILAKGSEVTVYPKNNRSNL